MKKILSRTILSLLLLLICSTQYGYCAEERPEQFVKDFYTWYITVDEGRQLAITHDDIYKYVAQETVQKVRNIPGAYGSDRRDYFLKMLDYPLNMSGVTIQVGKITDMGMATFVVPVTISTRFARNLVHG